MLSEPKIEVVRTQPEDMEFSDYTKARLRQEAINQYFKHFEDTGEVTLNIWSESKDGVATLYARVN